MRKATVAAIIGGLGMAAGAEAALLRPPQFANMPARIPESAPADSWSAASHPFAAARRETPLPLRLAHAILVKAMPERDTTITDVPEEVHLTFNEGVGTEFLALAVVDSGGKRVDNHDAKLDFTDHSNLRTSVSGD